MRGHAIWSCVDCGASVNVPERDALRRAEKAEARVAELERRLSAIRKNELSKDDDTRNPWTIHVIDDVLPRTTDSVSAAKEGK